MDATGLMMVRRVFGGMTNGLRGQLLRAGAGGFGIRILSLLATLVSSVVLARVLGDEGYGLYVFALSVTALLALPVQAGTPILVIREVATAEAAHDWVAMKSVRDWVFRVNVIFGTAVTLGILGFTWIAKDLITTELRHIFWVAAALVLPVALTSTLSATLRGLRQVTAGLYPSEVIRPFLISVLVGGLAYFSVGSSAPEMALILNLVATLGVLALLLRLVWLALPADSRGVKERAFQTRKWLRSLLPLALMSSLDVVNRTTDLVMIGMFRDPSEVGHYKIAVSSASFLAMGLSTVGIVSMPYIRGLLFKNDQRRLQLLASGCAAASVFLALPLFLVFLFFGGGLLRFVYGHDFVAAWEPMIILSAAQLVNAFFGVVGPMLLMAGHERKIPLLMGVSTIVNVVLNAILIPIYGITGAAMATGISILIWNLLYWLAVKRLIEIDTSLLGWISVLSRGKSQ